MAHADERKGHGFIHRVSERTAPRQGQKERARGVIFAAQRQRPFGCREGTECRGSGGHSHRTIRSRSSSPPDISRRQARWRFRPIEEISCRPRRVERDKSRRGLPPQRACEGPRSGFGEAIIALANAGADPYGKGASRRAYLHWAAAVGHIEAIAALLAAGADPDAKDF